MGAWRAWLSLSIMINCHAVATTHYKHLPLYVFTLIRPCLPSFLLSTICREGPTGRTRLRPGPVGRSLAVASAGAEWREPVRTDKPAPSPCTRQSTPTPRLSLSVHVALEGGNRMSGAEHPDCLDAMENVSECVRVRDRSMAEDTPKKKNKVYV